MADPDLQIRGGRGGGHPDPEIGLKIRGDLPIENPSKRPGASKPSKKMKIPQFDWMSLNNKRYKTLSTRLQVNLFLQI